MVPGGESNSDRFTMTEIRCPSCDAPLQWHEGITTLNCDFCGTTLHVSVPQRETGIAGDGSIRDAGSGMGLFVVHAPSNWQVRGASCMPGTSGSRPLMPVVDLVDGAHGMARIQLGDAGTRYDAAMKALVAMGGGAAAGYDTTNYADMPHPISVADAFVAQEYSGAGLSDLRLVEQVDTGDVQPLLAEARAFVDRQLAAEGVAASAGDLFAARVLRVYACNINGQPFKIAAYVKVLAARFSLGGMGAGIGALGGLVSGIGSLFGGGKQQAAGADGTQEKEGLFDFFMGGGLAGRAMRNRQAQQQPAGIPQTQQPPQAQPVPQAQQPAPQAAAAPTWCTADPAQWGQSGTYLWTVDLLSTYIAPESEFDVRFESEYLPFVTSVQTHPDIIRYALQQVSQQAAAIMQNTQVTLAQNQQAFQAQQAAHRQLQASYDASNQAWMQRQDHRQQAFRAATNAQFQSPAASAGGAGGVGDFSEAIRGVNTFVTSDGREVELSVHADVAYENQAGDVIGGSGGFDPGADWTQIPRQ